MKSLLLKRVLPTAVVVVVVSGGFVGVRIANGANAADVYRTVPVTRGRSSRCSR